MLDFLALRRSTSAVTLAAPAPSAGQLADLLRIAARAPDHGKLAPWRFIVLEARKAAFTARLDGLARPRRSDAAAKFGQAEDPSPGRRGVSSPKPAEIPEWEQLLSAGAVCTNLLYAALAMGFGANWITDWYSYDADAPSILGDASGSAPRSDADRTPGPIRTPRFRSRHAAGEPSPRKTTAKPETTGRRSPL